MRARSAAPGRGSGGFSPGENFKIGNPIWRIFIIFGKLDPENFSNILTTYRCDIVI